MCSKRGVSGQAACSYLMMGSWENDRCGIILEQFGLPKKPADAKVGKPCRLWIPSRAAGGCGHSRKPKLLAPCCRGEIFDTLLHFVNPERPGGCPIFWWGPLELWELEAQGVTLQLGEAAHMGITAPVCSSAYLGEQQRDSLDSAAHELLAISAECAISHAAT